MGHIIIRVKQIVLLGKYYKSNPFWITVYVMPHSTVEDKRSFGEKDTRVNQEDRN